MIAADFTLEETFLCQAIRHKDALDGPFLQELFEALGEKKAYSLCKQHDMASICADNLERCGIPTSSVWADQKRLVESTLSEYMLELDSIAGTFEAKNIRVIALKNSGIARGIYPFLASCPMGDVDVLVEKKNFFVAHKLLLTLGYEFKFRSQLETNELKTAFSNGGSEYCKKLASGKSLWLELQWRPISGRWIQPDQEPNGKDLFDRSISIPGTNVRLLCAEDNLLQVCLHTAKHTYIRSPGFRLHTDVDRIVREANIDWTFFLREVSRLKVRTATYFSLMLSKELLKTPIPAHILRKLEPSSWKRKLLTRWLTHTGLFFPEEKKWSNLGYICFVSFLYDDFKDFWRGCFPPSEYLLGKKDGQTSMFIAYLYISRLWHIIFKRTLN